MWHGTDANSHVQERRAHKRAHSGTLINRLSPRTVHNTFGHLWHQQIAERWRPAGVTVTLALVVADLQEMQRKDVTAQSFPRSSPAKALLIFDTAIVLSEVYYQLTHHSKVVRFALTTSELSRRCTLVYEAGIRTRMYAEVLVQIRSISKATCCFLFYMHILKWIKRL